MTDTLESAHPFALGSWPLRRILRPDEPAWKQSNPSTRDRPAGHRPPLGSPVRGCRCGSRAARIYLSAWDASRPLVTDWERVTKLRARGRSWAEIAKDQKVAFVPPQGADPGRALKTLYLKRRPSGTEGLPRSPGRLRNGDELGASRSTAGRRSKVIAWGIGIGLLVAVGGVLAYVLVAPVPGIDVVTYCGGEGTAAHYHPLLVINVNGAQQRLPYDPSQSADIGYINDPAFTNPNLYCPNGGIHALHTHDGSGVIHAELPSGVKATPTLGNFFTIWGQPLSSTQVWNYSGRVTAQVTNMNSGSTTDYSSDPSNIPLYTPPGGGFSNPFGVPQNLIFNGAYGNGQSGGTFDGEIIWLNVTTTGAAAAAPPGVCGSTIVCTDLSPFSSERECRGTGARSPAQFPMEASTPPVSFPIPTLSAPTRIRSG